MTTVTVEVLDVYTIIYQYPKLTTPSVIAHAIDINVGQGFIEFQPLGRDIAWRADDPLFIPVGDPITLDQGRVIALYFATTLRVVTQRT